MSGERGKRKFREGRVVSNGMSKTIVVRVRTAGRHPVYGKAVRRYKRFYAHDEEDTCRVGDLVRIVESRPLSKLKRWRLANVMERARE